MTNQTIALHGTKELLQQARKDLVAAGFIDDEWWNNIALGWSGKESASHLWIDEGTVGLHNHCYNADTVINLTSENYLEEIGKIISQKDELQKD